MKPNARRVRLDYCRDQKELEQKYICYEPDKVSGVPFDTGNQSLFLQTLPVDGWHLIYPEGNPYLISHSVIEFKAHPAGSSDWENYEAETEKFLRKCYSSRAIGAIGSGLTAEQYQTLSSWIKSTDNESMKAFRGVYTFRPTVKLSPLMFVVIDDEHDGSTPEKSLRLEPANRYDPDVIDHVISASKETRFSEAMRIIRIIKSMKLTPALEYQINRLEDIISLLKFSN